MEAREDQLLNHVLFVVLRVSHGQAARLSDGCNHTNFVYVIKGRDYPEGRLVIPGRQSRAGGRQAMFSVIGRMVD